MLILAMPAAQHVHLGGHDLGGVFASGAGDLRLHERLHAQADAVDAGLDPGARAFRRDGARSGFERGFEPGTSGDESEHGCQRVRVHRAGSSSAKVDRFRPPCPGVPCDFGAQRVQVACFRNARKYARGEVAVGTLLRAKRIGNVDSGHLAYDSVTPSLRSSTSCRKRASVSNGREPVGRSRDANWVCNSEPFSSKR
jgi:hypothetical protein